MTTSNYFFVIYLPDKVKHILDAMRLVSDPKQRNPAHITVKGPYKTRQKKRLIKDNRILKGKELRINNAGNFFNENQNTVFFQCQENKHLFNVWKTLGNKTYDHFIPHITIYDGNDRIIASKIFNTVNSHKITFKFEISELKLYSSENKFEIFNLQSNRKIFNLINALTGFTINEHNIDTLSTPIRISIIEKLSQVLEQESLRKDSDLPSDINQPSILESYLET